MIASCMIQKKERVMYKRKREMYNSSDYYKTKKTFTLKNNAFSLKSIRSHFIFDQVIFLAPLFFINYFISYFSLFKISPCVSFYHAHSSTLYFIINVIIINNRREKRVGEFAINVL